jgi:DNA-nicking Smr family endonuclease
MARRRRLSPEEEALWARVAESVEPLKARKASRPPAGEAAGEEAPPEAQKTPGRKAQGRKAQGRKAAAPPRPAAAAEAPQPKAPAPLEPGRLVDLDRRSAERLRRGKLPIEGLLDLHGHRQHEAEEELARFLAASQAAGKRCVLVVTGKGRWGSEAGVLRQRLGEWLNAAPNRARILAFHSAQPKHGGAGAFYILLRRLRG